MTTQGHQALLCDWYPTLQWLLDEVDGWRQEATQVLKNDYLALNQRCVVQDREVLQESR